MCEQCARKLIIRSGLVNPMVEIQWLGQENLQKLATLLDTGLLQTYLTNIAWAKCTLQSPQLDGGYIAQRTVSTITGIPGAFMRGKGFDLIDKSEVKSSSSIGAFDSIRFNHPFKATKPKERVEDWLNVPYIFYVLLDYRPPDPYARLARLEQYDDVFKKKYQKLFKAGIDEKEVIQYRKDALKYFKALEAVNDLVRLRVFVVNPREDKVYKSVLMKYYSEYLSKTKPQGQLEASYNFQLHPQGVNRAPIKKRSRKHTSRISFTRVVTNNCGNMELPLNLEAQVERETNRLRFAITEYDEEIKKCKLV